MRNKMADIDSEIQKELFDKILKNDVNGVTTLFSNYNLKPDIYDENNMTPIQHASYRGNKELVRFLLDQGANVNSGRQEFGYTALHFAALSGNPEVCQLLLENGAKTHVRNYNDRTPSQMAAFVGNYACVVVINNFVPKSDIQHYTQVSGFETEPKLPPHLVDPLHKFVMEANLHPVKIGFNLQKSPLLCENIDKVEKVLRLMCEREMKRGFETNEIMSFKFHYLACILSRVIKCKTMKLPEKLQKEKSEEKNDKKRLEPIELFIKSMLMVNKNSTCDYQDSFLSECITEFPYRECTIFLQMVSTLSRPYSPSPLSVIICAINGRRGFLDSAASICGTCGEEKATKRCSNCKSVQYCNRDCQRWHWFVHKKTCGQLSKDLNKNESLTEKEKQEAVNAATEALVSELQAMKTKN